ncbi:Gfo/Idh/MocA family oxidoreductase [Microlunatus elymi]|uniref:Gfo/Idh/MocA family oxidoreductase n=1 Tax=Microlunatus elymi TaxID=2596828 RepID=A0A516PUX2_9ACTN|nr:Gfo/Idh/MocA family oxidoreductase [Microlunatus elymi]QDP94962.1 Gfo/Idh/MocA family oxidoreductase [Microlunatus elymi]
MSQQATPLSSSEQPAHRELSVGIVGFGMRAGLWKYAHRPDDDQLPSRVTTICDLSERGRGDAAKALPDALITDDLDQLLDAGLDAVLVTTPDDQHFPVAMRALKAGVPVFCEKPLATTIAHCDTLLQTAYQTGTRLYVGHNMRHMPVVRQLRELIISGRIGEVKTVWCRHFVSTGGDFYFKDWHADRSRSTGLLLQKGAHDLDVIHWLAGGYSSTVSAMGDLMVYGNITDRTDHSRDRMWDWYDKGIWPPTEQSGLNEIVDVEDVSMMQMRLDNGVLASYEQCHFAPDYWRNYTVIGTKGRIENLGDGPGDVIAIWDHRHDGHAEPDEKLIIGEGDAGGSHGGADPRLISEFLRFAVHGGKTETSPIAARQAVAAGCVATDSLRSDGSARQVPQLPTELITYFEDGQQR